jgi:hypothetical protein
VEVTNPGATVPYRFAALIFAAALPFYLMLEESNARMPVPEFLSRVGHNVF